MKLRVFRIVMAHFGPEEEGRDERSLRENALEMAHG
jgi:hypothetical protein